MWTCAGGTPSLRLWDLLSSSPVAGHEATNMGRALIKKVACDTEGKLVLAGTWGRGCSGGYVKILLRTSILSAICVLDKEVCTEGICVLLQSVVRHGSIVSCSVAHGVVLYCI